MRIPAALALFTCLPFAAFAARVVTLGDSLTAEYDTIPSLPGFPAEATRYAEVTVAGWESMSWVEVLARVQRSQWDFGGSRPLSAPWPVPRLSGYEFNWGIPGIDAGQYEDFVTSSVLENFLYFTLRQPLEEQLKNRAERVVIWLGGNKFRASYGRLYDGDGSSGIIDGLIDDLTRIVDFVKKKKPRAQIVLVNIPDLGATPSKKAAHPDPARRARVAAAIGAANVRIAQLAAKKSVGLADVFATTDSLVRGLPLFLGGVRLVDAQHPDNEPRHTFTRDGLHPNTCLQIFNARSIAAAFNRKYNAGLPAITDTQALALLGISPHQPFFDWLKARGLTDRSFIADLDGDLVPQLIEFAFALDPRRADADALDVTTGGPVRGIVGTKSVIVTPDPALARYLRVVVQFSTDAAIWKDVPTRNVVKGADGAFTAVIPPTTGPTFLRLKASTIPPSGSTTSVSATVRFE
jgi:lysophospholipase L1-like esterase